MICIGIFFFYRLQKIRSARFKTFNSIWKRLEHNFRLQQTQSEATSQLQQEMYDFHQMRLDKSINVKYNALIKREMLRNELYQDYNRAMYQETQNVAPQMKRKRTIHYDQLQQSIAL